MNNKFNKILAIVLCLVMAVGSVAAVMEGAPAESPAPAQAPVTTEAPVETAVPTVPPVEETEAPVEESPVPTEAPAPSSLDEPEAPVCTCEATDEEKAAEGFTHAKGCPLYVPVCTCEGTEEEKAAEGFVHAEGCDFYEAPVDPNAELYEKLMATTTAEEFLALVEGMSEEDEKAFADSLSAEQLEALRAHIQEIAPAEEATPPQTVTFTDAGPFMPPVAVQTVRRLLRSVPNPLAEEQDNGLVTTKTATVNDDGTYTISIESYTTGTVTTSTKTTPVDVVLVLDQSGSMAYDFNGDSTGTDANRRQYAMKQAVNNFITAVNEKYTADADHRMAIVTFGSNAGLLQGWTAVDSAGKTALQGKINGLPNSPSGATNVAAGMGQAETLMGSGYNYTGSNTNRQKVVIVFTDGVPTTSNAFDVEVANTAITNANSLKAMGTTIYSIGIFTGANPNELWGKQYSREYLNDVACNGNVGEFWGHAWASSDNSNDFGDLDIPAANRFLNYVSNNYSASAIGIEYTDWGLPSGLSIGRGYFWTIRQATAAGGNAGYYLTANSADSLNNIFQEISENIGTPTIDLGAETVVKDIVSPYFTIPSDASGVKVYTASATSANGATWAAREESDLTPTVEGKTVSVSGFDFNSNFVSDKVKEDSSFGKKLIIEFTVTPEDGFVGGNDVPTNGDASGVYENSSSTESIEKFPVPTVNVPIKTPVIGAVDKTIYLGNSIPGTALYKTDYSSAEADAWKYAYVTVDKQNPDETLTPADCTDYNISLTYTPITDGSASAANGGTANSMDGVKREGTATVHVLKPKAGVTVNDVQKYYGEDYAYGDDNNAAVTLAWADAREHTGIPAAEGSAPYTADDLTLLYKRDGITVNGKTVKVPDADITVHISVQKGDAEIPATITTTCDKGCSPASRTDGTYIIHVKTCTLTITKSGATGSEEGFIFDVSGPETFKVSVMDNGTVTIVGLPVGEYTVSEDGAWSWRYVAQGTGNATLSAASPDGSVTINNEAGKQYLLDGNAYARNVAAATAN